MPMRRSSSLVLCPVTALVLAATGCKTVNPNADSAIKAGTGGAASAVDVKDWIPVPTQKEIDALIAKKNDDGNPYADYRPDAKIRGTYELPGEAILKAMAGSITFDAKVGDNADPSGCLNTWFNPTHWSDLQLHFYCAVATPRYCYTAAIAPVQSPAGKGLFLPRAEAFEKCMSLEDDFKTALKGTANYLNDTTIPRFQEWINHIQGRELFQYIMYAQTYAFDPVQEQAIINKHYGVTDPTDASECSAKRPRRAEDPTDGTHCLPTKKWSTQRTKSGTLEGIGR